MATPVIAIFDIGKTNKKLFLLDTSYRIVLERSTRIPEVRDEDGFPCEDLAALERYIRQARAEISALKAYSVQAMNVSAYGASLVCLDDQDTPITPLYNYLKPFPEELKNQFYNQYGGELNLSRETASPVLGSLNSGLQLYRIRHKAPEVFKKIRWVLHLPQYVSFLLSGKTFTELTSIGCHTHLWDFTKHDYHDWVIREGFHLKFPPIRPTHHVEHSGRALFGIGIHDSSAALIPYVLQFSDPFILISSGTWCISLNPFNTTPLTSAELDRDCLCYLQHNGNSVKAARLFAGHDHDEQVKRIASHFQKHEDFFQTVRYNPEIRLQKEEHQPDDKTMIKGGKFFSVALDAFSSAEEAYHHLVWDIIQRQQLSTQLVMARGQTKRIYVDGGFAGNDLYMNMLANVWPQVEVYAARVAQASALGAALAIHHAWNQHTLPGDLVRLKRFKPEQRIIL